MDSIIQRFQWCDNRFYPYLEKVLNRVPDQVRQDILDIKKFEIISDDDFLSAHGLHYHFDNPVTNLIYLNMINDNYYFPSTTIRIPEFYHEC
jgi:hypothetical protein